MKIDILTLFPKMFEGFLSESIIKRAIEDNKVNINTHNIRDYSKDPHKKVDDEPYGGGAGMVLMCQPVFDAVKKLQKKNTKVILMTPQGIPFNQKLAYNLSKEEHLLMICGHYEGFDERIRSLCDMEISIGDYVLTGGELPSMVITDAVVRLIDGVIDDESHTNDSFNDNLLDYPNYTKPREFEGLKVPDVLVSGHHKNIDEWRENEKLKRTEERRPDLLENKKFTFTVIKKSPYKKATIDRNMRGYSFNPRNDAKRTDVINITKMEIMEPIFVEIIARKNIERKLLKLLKMVMVIMDEGSEAENADLILGEAERLKSIMNNYLKILSLEYIESIDKRIDFIVKEFRIQKIMSIPVEEKEKSGRSR